MITNARTSDRFFSVELITQWSEPSGAFCTSASVCTSRLPAFRDGRYEVSAQKLNNGTAATVNRAPMTLCDVSLMPDQTRRRRYRLTAADAVVRAAQVITPPSLNGAPHAEKTTATPRSRHPADAATAACSAIRSSAKTNMTRPTTTIKVTARNRLSISSAGPLELAASGWSTNMANRPSPGARSASVRAPQNRCRSVNFAQQSRLAISLQRRPTTAIHAPVSAPSATGTDGDRTSTGSCAGCFPPRPDSSPAAAVHDLLDGPPASPQGRRAPVVRPRIAD